MVDQHGTDRPILHFKRAHLAINGYYNFSLTDISVNDSGTYTMHIKLNSPSIQLSDTVGLDVIRSAGKV